MSHGERTLYGYFRSSAAYRVRIALNLKGLDYRHIGVHLVRGGGEQLRSDYLRINPQALVPTFQIGDFSLTQSLAIIEYLDERFPEIPLLPLDIERRAVARQVALTIACAIHPLNNLRVLTHLSGAHRFDDEGKSAWITHWIESGFAALEENFASHAHATRFCVGETPSIADCCLVPQVFNARRSGVPLERYSHIERIASACSELEAFQRAHPDRQLDAETKAS